MSVVFVISLFVFVIFLSSRAFLCVFTTCALLAAVPWFHVGINELLFWGKGGDTSILVRVTDDAHVTVSHCIIFYSASTHWLNSCIHLNALVSWRSVWLATVEAITPDVYRSFSLGWIYFYKSIQICFCAASCTRGVNVLYKVFRSGIRFSPNSISQFSVFSRAFIILTVADKAIIFPPATTKCRQVPLWQCVCLRGEHKYYSAGHWWHALLATKPYQVEHNENRCYEHFCVLMCTSVSSFFTLKRCVHHRCFSQKPLTAIQ